jgi:hypothetical protein
MQKVHIKFTKAQIKQLQPLFDEVRINGGDSAILGQCFYDGMAARVIPKNKVMAIQKITVGHVSDKSVYSATQQMID